jgi:putative pyruvate formate lyase activating enzyme
MQREMWELLRPDSIAVLNDEWARKSLARYFSVMQNEKVAKFRIAKKISANFGKNDSLESLWKEHAKCTEDFCRIEHETDVDQNFQDSSVPEKSYFDLKIEIGKRMLRSCHFCHRKCNVNRTRNERGYCRCGSEMAVSSIFEHSGEEPELVPSGTIFTLGCTMRCLHCQNWTISRWMENGTEIKPEKLAKEVERLRINGCRNANLVGGEPTPWLQQWLETFNYTDINVPVVWNSNAYYSPQTAQLLAGFADIYLLDFKYGTNDCARKISDAHGYWEECTNNHLQAKKYGELIIRVLVLPNHLDCCTKPILKWIAEKMGIETRVNLMFQYRPEWRAHEIPELQRRLNRDEKEEAVRLANKAGLKNFIL